MPFDFPDTPSVGQTVSSPNGTFIWDGVKWAPVLGSQRGVTDGSNAPVGSVGEFISHVGSITYAAYPTDTTTSLALFTLAPGDWDLYASASFSSLVGGTAFFLNPIPPGFSTGLQGYDSFLGGVIASGGGLVLIGQFGRANITAATLLTFTMEVHMSNSPSLTSGGTMSLRVEGRRVR